MGRPRQAKREGVTRLFLGVPYALSYPSVDCASLLLYRDVEFAKLSIILRPF